MSSTERTVHLWCDQRRPIGADELRKAVDIRPCPLGSNGYPRMCDPGHAHLLQVPVPRERWSNEHRQHDRFLRMKRVSERD